MLEYLNVTDQPGFKFICLNNRYSDVTSRNVTVCNCKVKTMIIKSSWFLLVTAWVYILYKFINCAIFLLLTFQNRGSLIVHRFSNKFFKSVYLNFKRKSKKIHSGSQDVVHFNAQHTFTFRCHVFSALLFYKWHIL